VISQSEFTTFFTIWAPLLFPVPVSRVLIYDHSASQAFTGCIVGFGCALVYFYIVDTSANRSSLSAVAMIFLHSES
jgi:hypothetical protein